MATLSTANQAALTSAINLLLKGTARETPISGDVIQQIAPVVVGTLGLATTGGTFEIFRDNPVTALIALADACGGTLTTDQHNQLMGAALLMYDGQAYETPFAEDVIARLAPVAAKTGFLTQGGFRENIKDRPVSTMLQWALFLGKK